MKCISCKEEIHGEELSTFEGVVVCLNCARIALRHYSKAKKEMEDGLVLVREHLRKALIEGRLVGDIHPKDGIQG